LKGRDAVLKLLSEELKAQEARNSRLARRLDATKARLPDSSVPSSQKVDIRAAVVRRRQSLAVVRLRRDVAAAESEVSTLHDECVSLRELVRERSTELQSSHPDILTRFDAQKQELDKEIASKKEELKKIRTEEKRVRSEQTREITREVSRSQTFANDGAWETERQQLRGAIQAAKTEVRTLKAELAKDYSVSSRPPSSLSEVRKSLKRGSDGISVASSRLSNWESIYTDTALRQAMAAEIEAMRDDSYPLNVALMNERRNGDNLDEEIRRVLEAIARIREFQDETFRGVLGEEGDAADAAMKRKRIETLKSEYEELSTELRKFKVSA
jgi:hypothetical protein